jgi:hypothetical protein
MSEVRRGSGRPLARNGKGHRSILSPSPSHQQSRRQARDEFLDKALAAAGVPVFHFPVKRAYSVQDIRGAILE